MNPAFSSFSEKYFPTLHLVKFSATQFQLWDNYSIAWAKIEIQEEKVKIISIQQKSIQIEELDSINEEKNQFLEELSSLVTNFHTITISLLEKTQNDFLDRKKELEKQFRKGFSAKENESLQPVVQLLEEGGHSVYLLPKWIPIFEFWKILYQKTNFKKSFFKRQEILKSLESFYNVSHKNKAISSYKELKEVVTDFSKENKIQETELLLYGILKGFLRDNFEEEYKLDFIPFIQEQINKNPSQKIWCNESQILKSLEANHEELDKNTLFGTFDEFSDLLLAFSTQNETSSFAIQNKKPISQVGIFGISYNSELLQKIENSFFDLIILDTNHQNFHSSNEVSFFQSLSKKDKQLFLSIQTAFKQLSESGILFVLLDTKQKDFIEKKSLHSMRRLLEGWFERIEIYENHGGLGIFFHKKTELQQGVFYTLLNQNAIHVQNDFVANTWKPKPVLSDYQKLMAATSIFKVHYRAIPTQKIENFIELNSKKENNLIFKVKDFIQNHNYQVVVSEEKAKDKLEKKKNILASKLAENTLFEKDIVKIIEQKIQQTTDKKQASQDTKKELLYFNEKNSIETQVSVFEYGKWYYEKSIFEESYDLDKLFPNRKQGENILIFWANTGNGGEVWATDKPVPSSFLNEILPNAYIFPFYIYDEFEGRKRKLVNFSKKTLSKFRRSYAAVFEKRTENIEKAIQTLFDLSDFEFLQVHQELAFELQALSSVLDEDESKIVNEVKQNLHQPQIITYTQLEQISKTVEEVKRTFERLENKATRNKESHQTLKKYFENAEKAIEQIEGYWQKLELEETESFVIPTEQNMTTRLVLGYIFAVWQRDMFRKKYKDDLKSETPRIPVYKDFHHFANQGEFLLQRFLKQQKNKVEFEVVEVFEENNSKKTNKKSKNWFVKENKIWYDSTTFLQPTSELNFDTLRAFRVDKKSFFELILAYLKKNKVDLQEGKQILENALFF